MAKTWWTVFFWSVLLLLHSVLNFTLLRWRPYLTSFYIKSQVVFFSILGANLKLTRYLWSVPSLSLSLSMSYRASKEFAPVLKTRQFSFFGTFVQSADLSPSSNKFWTVLENFGVLSLVDFPTTSSVKAATQQGKKSFPIKKWENVYEQSEKQD